MKTLISSLLLAASACVPGTYAHTYLTQPLPAFKADATKASWVAEFSPPWPGSFQSGADYARVAPLQGYKDLRAFLEPKGPTCGNTLTNATAQAIPSDSVVKIARAIEYPGPCEIWLDDERVYVRDDCKQVLGQATSFNADFSSCKGSCMLRFYWLGMADGGQRWRAYKNCVALTQSRSLDENRDDDVEEEKEENGEEEQKKEENGEKEEQLRASRGTTHRELKTSKPVSRDSKLRGDRDRCCSCAGVGTIKPVGRSTTLSQRTRRRCCTCV